MALIATSDRMGRAAGEVTWAQHHPQLPGDVGRRHLSADPGGRSVSPMFIVNGSPGTADDPITQHPEAPPSE